MLVGTVSSGTVHDYIRVYVLGVTKTALGSDSNSSLHFEQAGNSVVGHYSDSQVTQCINAIAMWFFSLIHSLSRTTGMSIAG